MLQNHTIKPAQSKRFLDNFLLDSCSCEILWCFGDLANLFWCFFFGRLNCRLLGGFIGGLFGNFFSRLFGGLLSFDCFLRWLGLLFVISWRTSRHYALVNKVKEFLGVDLGKVLRAPAIFGVIDEDSPAFARHQKLFNFNLVGIKKFQHALNFTLFGVVFAEIVVKVF